VTRSATVTLSPGVYDLLIPGLPAATQTDTLQARVSGPLKLMDVTFEERRVGQSENPEIAALDTQIESVKQELWRLEQQLENLKKQDEFINAVTIRASGDASKEAGTDALNLDRLSQQMSWANEQRSRLIQERQRIEGARKEQQTRLAVLQSQRSNLAAQSDVQRVATVAVVCTEASEAKVELTYLVGNASWQPRYAIRAARDGSAVDIEYDALIAQQTGEHWEDVAMTLSTAQPTLAANPPEIEAWYIDEYQSDRTAGVAAESAYRKAAPGHDVDAGSSRDQADKSEFLGRRVMDAEIDAAGPSVTYTLPRRMTIKTNAKKEQRTRIATIATTPEFVHVAIPSLTDRVYVRGDLKNESAYQLLPGHAAIYSGQDYVGPTTLDAIPPRGEFKLHFGEDPAVTTSRQLVSKRTSSTGLFGGGLRTSYEFRIEINNGAGKDIKLELWDRIPVSRTDKVEISLLNLSHALAKDKEYLDEQRPTGLLKWMLGVGAQATNASPFVVTYNMDVNRGKDVNMTPLPE
jgi:uncharacterized protein (TIGR02231 family)